MPPVERVELVMNLAGRLDDLGHKPIMRTWGVLALENPNAGRERVERRTLGIHRAHRGAIASNHGSRSMGNT